jgi:hypothetical protein
MNKLKQYKQQIFTFVTIVLLATYGIFPALTAANTLLNILGGIGALLLLIWGGLSLYEYVKSSDGLVDVNELKEASTMKAEPKPKRSNKEQNLNGGEIFSKDTDVKVTIKPKRKPKTTK